MLRWLLAGLLVLHVPLVAGCTSDSDPANPSGTNVQGIVRAYQFNGQAVLIDHEAIPGRMEAMRMSFRLQDPAAWQNIRPGTKISFTMVEDDLSHVASNPQPLPDSVQLHVPAPTPPPVPRN